MSSFDMYNLEGNNEMPFGFEKKGDNMLNIYFEDSHDSYSTNQTTTSSRKECPSSPSGSESSLKENEMRMDKLMQDLDFIDQPLAPKRIRK